MTVYGFELRLDNIMEAPINAKGLWPMTMDNLDTDLASHVFSQGWPEHVS